MDFYFSYSFHQLWNQKQQEHTKMIMDHILTDSPEKEIWSGLLEIKLSLFKRTSLLKLNEHHEISFRSMKNYSHEIFVLHEILKS